MLSQSALMSDLERFGMTPSTARVYVALLFAGESSASKLSKLTGIHRVDMYKRLQTLLDSGLSNVKLGRPSLYQAVDADTALSSILALKQKELDDLRESRSKLLSDLKRASFAVSATSPPNEPLYKMIVGRHHGYTEARYLLQTATKDVDRVVSANGLKRNYNLKLLRDYKACADRGVRIRIISDLSKVPKHIVRFCNAHFDLRHSSQSTMRILVVDKKMLLLSAIYNDKDPSIQSTSDRYLLVVDENFAKVISLMFELLWKSSISAKAYL